MNWFEDEKDEKNKILPVSNESKINRQMYASLSVDSVCIAYEYDLHSDPLIFFSVFALFIQRHSSKQ